MTKRLMTADQVKKHLNITDFRHVSRDKLIEFVSTIPEMDKEVAIKAIEQFPEFSSYAKDLVSHYETVCNSILTDNENITESVLEGYKKTLDTLSVLAESDNIDSSDKCIFAEKMVELTAKMATLDKSNKDFLSELVKSVTCFTGGTLLVCATVLGVRIIRAKTA